MAEQRDQAKTYESCRTIMPAGQTGQYSMVVRTMEWLMPPWCHQPRLVPSKEITFFSNPCVGGKSKPPGHTSCGCANPLQASCYQAHQIDLFYMLL